MLNMPKDKIILMRENYMILIVLLFFLLLNRCEIRKKCRNSDVESVEYPSKIACKRKKSRGIICIIGHNSGRMKCGLFFYAILKEIHLFY